MIHMPRRSVTRFFIPLIDVLLLLFGIFLLMPMVVEEGVRDEEERKRPASERLAARVKQLEGEVENLTKQQEALSKIKGLEKLLPDLARLEELRAELERLRKLTHASVQEKIFVRVLDVDPKTGEVSYFDGTRPEKERLFRVVDEKTARYLIEKHRRQAGSRELYYYFVTREDSGFPTVAQRRELTDWFAGVPNSLASKDS